jgi:hypothetical protein
MQKFTCALGALWIAALGSNAVAEPPEAPADPGARGYLVEFAKPSRSYTHLGRVGPYYPDVASRSGVNGAAVIECDVGPERELLRCSPVAERPTQWGFIEALMRMAAAKYILAPGEAGMPPRANFIVKFEQSRKRR